MAPNPTGKSRLLLIDTCVIIEAHRLDIWPAIRGQCRVAVPETVVGEAILVAREYDDLNLRLETEIAEGLIESPALPASDLLIVKEKCPPFPGQIDAGELECLPPERRAGRLAGLLLRRGSLSVPWLDTEGGTWRFA